MKPSIPTRYPRLRWLLVASLAAALPLFSLRAPAQSAETNSAPAQTAEAKSAPPVPAPAVAAPAAAVPATAVLLAAAAPAAPVAAASEPAPVGVTPDQALERLVQGNQRYVAGKAAHPDQTIQRRLDLVAGQAPFAIILTCSDSRVAPELFFDQGMGDLFVIRNAGNILDDHVIGSMEYAVEHLHAGLIVVVGHGNCGAVSAAVAGGEVPGHIRSVTDAIAPALDDARNLPGDKVDNTVRANAQRVANTLTHVEPFLKNATKEGHLKIVAARYDLGTGQVEILK